MEKKYELEVLSEEFELHSRSLETLKDFCLPIALKSMVDELLTLRKRLDEVTDIIYKVE